MRNVFPAVSFLYYWCAKQVGGGFGFEKRQAVFRSPRYKFLWNGGTVIRLTTATVIKPISVVDH